MEEIISNEKQLPNSLRVINIEKYDDYLFVETDMTSLIFDICNNVYDVGKYNHLVMIYEMGDDLVAVLEGDGRQALVNVRTKEVYLTQSTSYYSGIFKVDDDYVHLMGPDYDRSVFNIRNKKFIKPDVDIKVEFTRKVTDNLFEYSYNDYLNKVFKNFLINQNGELVYECGPYFPYFKDGNLILSLLKDDEIIIVYDLFNGRERKEVLNKNGMISSNPFIHTTNQEPDSICFISGKEFLIVDFNMNVIKTFSLDIEYDDVEIQLCEDMAVIIVTKNDETYCIGLNINNGVQIKHQGIWVLPIDIEGKKVIRGCDSVGEDNYVFTLYDLEGNEYTHHLARDCFNIHSSEMNKYIFYGVDGTINSLVYNIDTGKEVNIPWRNPQFNLNKNKYMSIGYAFRSKDIREDQIIDFFDEEFNIVIEGINASEYGIRDDNFAYDYNNGVLLLTVSVSDGPKTYYRKLAFDKNKNVMYDDYFGYLSFVGNYIQVIDDEEDKTYFINTMNGEITSDASLTMENFDLPSTIEIGKEPMKLIMKNEENSTE